MKTSANSRKSNSLRRRQNYRPNRSVAAEWLEERLLLSSTLGGAPCSPAEGDVQDDQSGTFQQQSESAQAC